MVEKYNFRGKGVFTDCSWSQKQRKRLAPQKPSGKQLYNYTEIKKTQFITIVLNVYNVLQVLKVNTLHVHTLYSFKLFILLLDCFAFIFGIILQSNC